MAGVKGIQCYIIDQGSSAFPIAFADEVGVLVLVGLVEAHSSSISHYNPQAIHVLVARPM